MQSALYTASSPSKTRLAIAVAVLLAGGAAHVAHAANVSVCEARSGATPPAVVELYTSEGCSSCPPADRWLSTLKGRSDVLALAFHVTYWDRLGWPDRFATPEGTARQHALARQAGSAQVYTPQVLVDGRDWRGWPQLPQPAAADGSAPQLTLRREGDLVTAEVAAQRAAPKTGTARWSGYWAVLEDRHESRVRAGENAGETLAHDQVVRLLQPVAAWPATAGSQARLTVSAGVAAHPRSVVFVVTDAASARPLQALKLAC
jgi:hypothetical protein